MKKVKINFQFLRKKSHLPLILIVVILSAFGCVMIYSASSYSAAQNYGSSFFFVRKQIIGLIIGFIAMMFFSYFDYMRFKKYKWHIITAAVVLLILVLIPAFSVSSFGARRWIKLPGFTLQPGEIAKFAFVFFAASHFADEPARAKSFIGLIPVFLAGGVLCFLIMLQPNMSTAMCIAFSLVSMVFIAGITARHFIMIAIPGIFAVPALIIAEPYRLKRLSAFLDPWASPLDEGFQLIQSLYSLGSGGLFGVGLFQSRQKYLFLPFSESDFIFSIIGEELGFFGCLAVLAAFGALVYIGVKIAMRAKDRFGAYLAFGISMVIIIQVLVNIAVVSGSIPPTGLPLPFISAGNTSLIVFMSAIGVLNNIHISSKTKSYL